MLSKINILSLFLNFIYNDKYIDMYCLIKNKGRYIMPRSELTKKCQGCNVVKPLSEYYNNLTKRDGRNGICKECQKKSNNK